MCTDCKLWLRALSPDTLSTLVDRAHETATIKPTGRADVEAIYGKPFNEIAHRDFARVAARDLAKPQLDLDQLTTRFTFFYHRIIPDMVAALTRL